MPTNIDLQSDDELNKGIPILFILDKLSALKFPIDYERL